MRALVECRIKPYYLHHADLAPGTAHLRTTIAEGQALMRALHGRSSGLCQPTYVLDIPGGHGKSPIGPNYLSDGRRHGRGFQRPAAPLSAAAGTCSVGVTSTLDHSSAGLCRSGKKYRGLELIAAASHDQVCRTQRSLRYSDQSGASSHRRIAGNCSCRRQPAGCSTPYECSILYRYSGSSLPPWTAPSSPPLRRTRTYPESVAAA